MQLGLIPCAAYSTRLLSVCTCTDCTYSVLLFFGQCYIRRPPKIDFGALRKVIRRRRNLRWPAFLARVSGASNGEHLVASSVRAARHGAAALGAAAHRLRQAAECSSIAARARVHRLAVDVRRSAIAMSSSVTHGVPSWPSGERGRRRPVAEDQRTTSSDGSSGTSVASSADSRAQTNGVRLLKITSASVPGCSRSRRQGVLRARWPVHSESAAGRSIRPRGDSKVRGARSESGAVRVRHVSVSVMRLRGRLSSHACKSRYGFLGGRPRD